MKLKIYQINLFSWGREQEGSLEAVTRVLLSGYLPGPNKFIFVSAGKY